MAANPYRPGISDLPHRTRMGRGLAFGAIIVTALLAFEVFNYGTTEYALSDLLGELEFAGLHWATILAIAFCGIDFAGIARLFTPETGQGHDENWFLFGAWLLAATMNAMLTWWGVSLAILGNQMSGEAVVARETMLHVGPVFVAVLVWLIRVLIIGTFSVAGDRLFNLDAETTAKTYRAGSRQEMRSQPAGLDGASTASRLESGRPGPSQPPAKRAPLSERTGALPGSSSRSKALPAEPEYEDNADYAFSESGAPRPVYTRSPLAARGASQVNQRNNSSTQETSSNRMPVPPRRKS